MLSSRFNRYGFGRHSVPLCHSPTICITRRPEREQNPGNSKIHEQHTLNKLWLYDGSSFQQFHCFGQSGNKEKQNQGASCERIANLGFCSDDGVTLSYDLYLSLMKDCINRNSLIDAKLLHMHLACYGLELNSFLGEQLVLTLVKCGGLEDAYVVFNAVPFKSVLSWTAMISGYTEREKVLDALLIYQCMKENGVEPNEYTFVSLLKACGNGSYLRWGRKLHNDLLRGRFLFNTFIRSCLISMYGKCGSILDAENVFVEFFDVNPVLWNAMLSTYAERGEGEKTLQLYRQMIDERVHMDVHTFCIILQACVTLLENIEAWDVEVQLKEGLLGIGQAIHGEIHKKGFGPFLFVGNNLVSMYGKFGRMTEAEYSFLCLLERTVVSWSLLISGYAEQDQGESALLCYRQMHEEGVKPDERMLVIALQACESFLKEGETCVGDETYSMLLDLCRALHADAEKQYPSLNNFVANTLVSLYGKCRSIREAENVFFGMPRRDVVSWNALLSVYIEHGEGVRWLQLYKQMQLDGIGSDQRTFVSAFQACLILSDIVDGFCQEFMCALHIDARRRGFLSDKIVGSTLVRAYGKCGMLDNAESMCAELVKMGVQVWNAMLSAYLEQGQEKKVLHLYRTMLENGVWPDKHTFVQIFRSCSALAEKEASMTMDGRLIKATSLEILRALHLDANNKDLASCVFVRNTLLSAYGKCGALVEAEIIFEGLPHCNVVCWNTMLSAYVDVGDGVKALRLFRQMVEGVDPNELTLVVALQACNLLEDGPLVEGEASDIMAMEIVHALHAEAFRKWCPPKVIVANTLLSLYGKCGRSKDAENLFSKLSHRDVVSWSAMLLAYVEQGHPELALQLYVQMQKEGINPDDGILVVLLQACGSIVWDDVLAVNKDLTELRALEIGHALHADVLKLGYVSNVNLCSTLIRMYGKCGSVSEAESVFSSFGRYNVASWNARLSTYLEQSQDCKALCLYKEMQELCVRPDKWTMAAVLQACATFAEKEAGFQSSKEVVPLTICQALHDVVVREGFEEDLQVESSLISTYSKCGHVKEAEKLFERSLECNFLLPWNAILSAYVEYGLWDKALHLFISSRVKERIPWDVTAFFSVLQACSEVGSLEVCKHLHYLIISAAYDLMPSLACSLMHAHGSCASTEDAFSIFLGIRHPDVAIWSACISGYVRIGDMVTSLQMLETMEFEGVDANSVTFLSLLSACNHAGLVDVGIAYYDVMRKDYGLVPELKHYTAMVELLGRAGYLAGCEKLLESMPIRADLPIWLCLLGASLTHGNLDMGKAAFTHAIRSHPNEAAAYVLMSNIYAEGEVSMEDLGALLKGK